MSKLQILSEYEKGKYVSVEHRDLVEKTPSKYALSTAIKALEDIRAKLFCEELKNKIPHTVGSDYRYAIRELEDFLHDRVEWFENKNGIGCGFKYNPKAYKNKESR